MDLQTLLQELSAQKGSDLHLVVGQPPVFRIDGALVRQAGPPLDAAGMEALLLPHLTAEQRTALMQNRQDLDVSLWINDTPFRCNLFRERGRLAAAIRVVPRQAPTIEQLFSDTGDIGPTLRRLIGLPRGLILITGATGSGKTTTCAAMIEEMNRTMTRRILTLEDPIEYEFTSKQSLITQRTVGDDVATFAIGARGAFRTDADVIVINELRDLETVQYALALAESGHLVFSILHMESASEAIKRLIEVFPEPRDLIRRMISRTLAAVIAQRLVPRSNRPGRVAANEVLLATPRICRMIVEGNSDLTVAIEAGREQGMHTMDDCLLRLLADGKISYDTAWTHIDDHERLGPYTGPAPRAHTDT